MSMETLQYPTETKAIKEHKCNFCCQTIDKGSKYLKSKHTYDGLLYTWKSHKHCSEICSKLKMYEDADEGVTTDFFIETIKDEYQNIMSETQNELYESKEFVYPDFKDRLLFVLQYHKVLTSKGE